MSYGTNMIRVCMEDVEDENDFSTMVEGDVINCNGVELGIYMGRSTDGMVWVRI